MDKVGTLFQTTDAWAQIVLDRWQKKIDQLGIGYSLQLADSLRKEVFNEAGGNAAGVEFAFLYYGKFVDMGVGKGVDLGSSGDLKVERRLIGRATGNRRVPKKWYSPVFYTEVAKLKFILAEKYAHKGVLSITENLDDNAMKWGHLSV